MNGWAYTEGVPNDCVCGAPGRWIKRFGEGFGDVGTLSYSQNQGWGFKCSRTRDHSDWINWNSYKRLDKRGRELERNDRAEKQRKKKLAEEDPVEESPPAAPELKLHRAQRQGKLL